MLRRSRPQLRPAPLRRRRASCPALEPLEGRALLATFTVTNGNDSGAGSLRAALLLADQNGGADTIDFAPSVAQVSLTSGRLQINSDLTILGPSSGVTITRTSANTFGIFRVQGGVTARLEKVIINSGSDYSGGGVQNAGLLTIVSSTLSGNTGETGGAVYNSGVLTLSACTVISNTARSGGGVYNGGRFAALGTTFSGNSADFAGGALTNFNSFSIVNSTFSGNSTLGYGGAVSNEQLVDGATLEITSSTFSGNSANNLGDSIFNLATSDPLVLNNTLVAGTSDLLSGTFTGSNNLVQDGSGTGLTGTVVADPLLGPLADNGGPTRTHAILPGSPAINAGSNALALDPQGNPLTTDQRGPTFPRIKMGTVDIGAYESPYETSSLVVTTGDDVVNPSDGLTSLREAVAYAAIKPGADTITFVPSVFAVLLTSGQITLDSNVTIRGQSAGVTIARASANEFRIVEVKAGVTAALENLTITGGRYSGNLGGGIFNKGVLTLTSCTVSANFASGTGGIFNDGTLTLLSCTVSGNSSNFLGGGIRHQGNGLFTLLNSTISGNSSVQGGGILNSGPMVITNSTISGNSATDTGGGIYSFSTTQAKVTNSTIAGNTATVSGGGIFLVSGVPVKLDNTIVAGNGLLLSGTFTGSNNLVQDGSGTGLIGTIAADPLLGPLADNGGPTRTHAILLGSPAINAGSNALALDSQGNPLTTDQRGPGFPRIQRSIVDLGAFESPYETPSLVVTTGDDVVNPSDGLTSLRETVAYAAIKPGADTITFAPSVFAVLLTSGQITLDSNVSILGQGAVVTIARASANEFRIFDVPAGVSARLENLTVTGGLVPLFTLGGGVRNAGTLSVFACVFLNNSAYDGGAIQNYGTLSVDSSTFTGNAATVRGGGLKNEGTATVTASSFSGNSASLGGGVMNVASFTVTNSTFSGNSAASGGGIFHNVGMLKVVNSTLAANTASTGARGIDLAGGSATLNNTVVAGSGVLLSGTFTGSSNLVQDGSGTGLTGTIVADPLLGPLADNGGPTQTHALLPGSPAINAGSNALALDAQGNPLTTDQRGPGFPRILGGTVDIGSFELRSVPIAVAIVRADPDPTNAASVRFTVTFSSAVTGVDATDFQVVAPGIIGAGVTGISPAGPAGTYSVTVGTGNGDGTLQLNLVDDDTIRDASDQPLGGPGSGNGNLAGPAYTIDKTAPTVSKVFVAWGNQVYDIQNIGTTRTLPWFGIRRVDVVFSEGLANSTLLTSALNITTEVASGPAGGYSYSDATRTASWSTLGLAPATVARLLLALNTNLHDVAGNGLAISTSATKFVLSGGNYSLTTNILPGDFNGDGLVNVFDGVGIRNKFTPLINDPTAIWADMDGDGDVDPDDYNLSRGQVGKRKLSS